jgi:hypothetical protein
VVGCKKERIEEEDKGGGVALICAFFREDLVLKR